MPDWEIERGGAELLDRVGPLWERLARHHASVSPSFAVRHAEIGFAQRKEGLLCRAEAGALCADLVRLPTAGEDVGYCVTTVLAGRGEVESLFLDEALRGRGLGSRLVERALAWLDELGVERCIVGVAVGNEAAFPLYERFGFRPRTTILERPGVKDG